MTATDRDRCYEAALRLEGELHDAFLKGTEAHTQCFCYIFAYYLAILDQNPGDEEALARLYRVAVLFRTSPPKLADIMSRARTFYQERLGRNPADAQACVRISQIESICRGEGSGAEWAERALQIDAGTSDARLQIARVYFSRGNSDAASASIDRAISLDPGNSDAYAFKANMLLQRGERTAALKAYRKSFEKDPTHLEAVTYLHSADPSVLKKTPGRSWWKFW